MVKIYAGIGSRKTPPDMLAIMTNIAEQLDGHGFKLRSGNATGADQAFQWGANSKEIHLPWEGFNNPIGEDFIVPKPYKEIQEIAAQHHPKWDGLSDPVKLLMCRNVTIVLGQELNEPARFVLCWTPEARLTGGTALGIKVADAYDIPCFNLAEVEQQHRFCEFANSL